MPLVKSASKDAFRKNVKTEMAHGKPQKQAVAIAYNTQRGQGACEGQEVTWHATTASTGLGG
jgi:hypothetical protein